MNYQKIYNQLVQKNLAHPAQKIPNTYGSIEYHHIIPLCLNGPDVDDNKVIFTPRAHYIAHLLLWKIYPDNIDLSFALLSMAGNTNATNMREFRYNSKLFEAAKIAYGKLRYEYFKTHDGTIKGKILTFNTKTKKLCYVDPNKIPTECIKATYIWIYNPITLCEQEWCELLPIPNGYVKGRKPNKRVSHKNQIQISNDTLNLTMYINKDDPIPDGWRVGCRNKEQRKIKTLQCVAKRHNKHIEMVKEAFDYFVSVNYSISKLKLAFPEFTARYKADRYINQCFTRYSKTYTWKMAQP